MRPVIDDLPRDLRSRILAHATFAAVAVNMLFWTSLMVLASTLFPARRIHCMMRFATYTIMVLTRNDLSVRGREHLPAQGGCLLVSNHVNMFDPMFMYLAVPRYCVAIEEASHFKWPLYGTMITRWGNIPVGGKDRALTARSMARAADVLRAGTPVFIFPEGTRARDGRLGTFRRGAFSLALEARVPLIPVAFRGAEKIFLEGSNMIFPGREEIVFIPPVPLDDYGPDDADALSDEVRRRILEALEA